MARKTTGDPVLSKRHNSAHIRRERAERRERERQARKAIIPPDDGPKCLQFNLPFQTDEVLLEFTRLAFGVRFPAKACCPAHTAPAKAFCDAYFARHPISVWKGSRGFSGKTFMLSTLSAVEAATLGCDVVLLGGSGQQSQRALEASTRIWSFVNAPRHLLASGELGLTVVRLAFGNTITALTASQKAVRGLHPVRLRLDEIDTCEMPIIDAALGQTMQQKGVKAQTVLSSTHQVANGTMTEILKRANERSWQVCLWCYRCTLDANGGWLASSEVGRKQNEVTKAMWDAEYELIEPSPEGRAIDDAALKRMFDPSLGVFDGRDGEYVEIERPDPHGVYAHGADWAKAKDFTVIVTLRRDCEPMRLVAFERMNRLPWPLMVAKLDQRIERFGGKTRHDGTGLGDVVDGYLEADKRNCEPVILVGRARLDLFSKYIAAIERSEIVSPMVTFMEREHRYCIARGAPVLTRDGWKPIEKISAGALVATRHGWRRVLTAGLTGWRRTVEIRAGRYGVRVTPDHQVATSRGFVRADSLSVGSLVCVVADAATPCSGGRSQSVLRRELMPPFAARLLRFGASTHVGSMIDGFEMLGIATSAIAAKVVDFLFGRDRFTPCFVGSSMGEEMLLNMQAPVTEMVACSLPLPTSRRGDLDALREVVAQRDSHTDFSEASIAPARSFTNERRAADTFGPANSAPDGAVSSQSNAATAASWFDFEFWPGHIINRLIENAQPVYDLSVEGAHEFVAGGIVVHNCTTEDIYGSGHPPDTLVAGALAYEAAMCVPEKRGRAGVGFLRPLRLASNR